MKKLLIFLPVLLISACITINTLPVTQSAKQNLPPNGIKMKPPTESQPFVDTTDGLTYKWIKVRVYSSYPTALSSDRVIRRDVTTTVTEPSPLSEPPPPPAKPAMRFAPVTGTFKDGRDGQVYKTVTIGKQTWMAQNLNYKTPSGSFSYNNDEKNRAVYGLLYNFDVIGDACPKGWHVPTDAEWSELEYNCGMNKDETDTKMYRGSIAENLLDGGISKMNIQYSGEHRQGADNFSGMGEAGYYFTSSHDGIPIVSRLFRRGDSRIAKNRTGSAYGMSVRCVKDEAGK